jgi:hypothetical protein
MSESLVGCENCYTCQECRKIFTTVDRADGVTPFMVSHRGFDENTKCKGMCYSAFYPKGPRPAHIPAPSHEWYKPDTLRIAQMAPAMREHINKGGLDLRRIAA